MAAQPKVASCNQTKTHGPALAAAERPAQAQQVRPEPKGKLGALIGLLRRPEGVRIGEMMAATGWQAQSVRGAIAGALKKKAGLAITSQMTEAGRVYRIAQDVAA